MESDNSIRESESRYITNVKQKIHDLYKSLPRKSNDIISTFFEMIDKCNDKFWRYKAINPHFPKGAEDWFPIVMRDGEALKIIQDEIIPLLKTAESNMGRFPYDIQSKFMEVKLYVETRFISAVQNEPQDIDVSITPATSITNALAELKKIIGT